MKKDQTPWSDEEKALVKRMSSEGYSSGDIVKSLRGRSRSAVIGIISRSGYERPGAPAHKNKPLARVGPRRVITKPAVSVRATPPVSVPLPKVPELPPECEPVPLEALTRTSCRFPVTSVLPYKFCGAHADGTYCAYHARVAVRAA